jgi:hypothetical protein
VNSHNQNAIATEQSLGKGAFVYPITIAPAIVHKMPQIDRRAYNAAKKNPTAPGAQETLKLLEGRYGQQ